MINLNSSSNNSMTDDETDPMKTESDNSITDYSTGLPSIDDITPLSQSLIPFQLASAFKITQETPRTMSDVTKASNSTFSSLNFNNSSNNNNNNNNNQPGPVNPPDPKRIRPGSDEDDTVLNEEQQLQQQQGGNSSSKNSAKRPRLVWTPQLHKRFVEVVAHLGLKNAVPKTIMQLMNVEGLTRENVASHLQKYRLYVKRMQENDDDSGANNNINSSNHSDNLFASTPIPRFNESYSGQGNNTNTNTNNNSSSNNNNVNSGHAEIGMPGMGFYEGGGGGNNSLHHHHHYHHHYQQQQYGGGGGGGNMGQQQNNYGSNAFTTHHHLAQK